MIGIPLGLLYANGAEWALHKYVLHGLGKNKKSIWSFHWKDHHGNARRNGHYDVEYEKSVLHEGAQQKEAISLGLLTISHLPLFPIAPFFTSALVYSSINYYIKHKKAHNDPDWARENLPWHYDHHMGPNQDSNWCVTRPWFDHIMGTREFYLQTPKEEKMHDKDVDRYKKISSPDKIFEREMSYEENTLESIVSIGKEIINVQLNSLSDKLGLTKLRQVLADYNK